MDDEHVLAGMCAVTLDIIGLHPLVGQCRGRVLQLKLFGVIHAEGSSDAKALQVAKMPGRKMPRPMCSYSPSAAALM